MNLFPSRILNWSSVPSAYMAGPYRQRLIGSSQWLELVRPRADCTLLLISPLFQPHTDLGGWLLCTPRFLCPSPFRLSSGSFTQCTSSTIPCWFVCLPGKRFRRRRPFRVSTCICIPSVWSRFVPQTRIWWWKLVACWPRHRPGYPVPGLDMV